MTRKARTQSSSQGPLSSGGLCGPTSLTLRPCQLLGLVCRQGGIPCPLLEAAEAAQAVERLSTDPTATVRLVTPADMIPHYTQTPRPHACPADVFNRKRDLDVLQRLGLSPGDTRRARYLIELLFERVPTPDGICAYTTPNWTGCEFARSGAYEEVRAQGWQALVYHRRVHEMAEARSRNVEAIRTSDRLYIRPHHLLCFCCGFNGGTANEPRPNDTLFELFERMRTEPDVPVTLVEGCCMACDCCDGFFPENGRCVHSCGLIRDFKKDLDVLQKLGLMPGATLPARELLRHLFETIGSTREVCGYGDGVCTAREWTICGSPEGNPGYTRTREAWRTGHMDGRSEPNGPEPHSPHTP